MISRRSFAKAPMCLSLADQHRTDRGVVPTSLKTRCTEQAVPCTPATITPQSHTLETPFKKSMGPQALDDLRPHKSPAAAIDDPPSHDSGVPWVTGSAATRGLSRRERTRGPESPSSRKSQKSFQPSQKLASCPSQLRFHPPPPTTPIPQKPPLRAQNRPPAQG